MTDPTPRTAPEIPKDYGPEGRITFILSAKEAGRGAGDLLKVTVEGDMVVMTGDWSPYRIGLPISDAREMAQFILKNAKPPKKEKADGQAKAPGQSPD